MAKRNAFQSKRFLVVEKNFTACSLPIQQCPKAFNFILMRRIPSKKKLLITYMLYV